jgi:hypothetical protein
VTENEKDAGRNSKDKAFRVRLPGFVRDEEIGLGDVRQAHELRRRNPFVWRLRKARRGPEPEGDFHPLNHCERNFICPGGNYGTPRDT